MGLPLICHLPSEVSYVNENRRYFKKYSEEAVIGKLHMPKLIGHRFKPVEVIPIEKLQTTYKDHRRLRVFAAKGLKCAYCSRTGVHLIRALDNNNGSHVDVYTRDFHLMTIDHVVPRSKGGSEDLSNLVPCCSKCNSRKSDKLLTPP